MYKKIFWFAVVISFLWTVSAVQADYFDDDFNEPYDYVANNVYGVDWDGMIGLGPGETVDAMDANTTNAPNDANLSGLLYMQSTLGNWDTMSPYGPLLYKEVDGDFVAQVEVKAISCCWGSPVVDHADSGIMARVPNLADAGAGEDHISLQYFGRWCGHLGRSMNNGGETEFGCSGGTCNDYRWIRLTRTGSTFYLEISMNGVTWGPLADDVDTATRTRTDIGDVAILQVGIEQCTYNNTTGYVSFDNFSVSTTNPFPAHPYARIPTPVDGATDVNYTGTTLRWKEGDNVDVSNGHYLYFSDDLSKVEGRDASVRTILSTTNNALPDLMLTKTYYWCVDEYKTGDPCSPWEGPIWQFTTTNVRARNPNPPHNQGGVDECTSTLTWTTGGALVLNQDLYFSNDYTKVLNGDPSVRVAQDLAGNATSYPTPGVSYPTCLEQGTQYFWRVDSNCGSAGLVEGNVWIFKTAFPKEFCDDFEADVDYLIDGTEGTIWDGYIGNPTALATDINDGKLYIESTGTTWSGNQQGILLYKEVAGSCLATVEITDYPGLWESGPGPVNNNWGGIMARVGKLDDAGAGEDWITIAYFPLWNNGNRGDLNGWGETNFEIYFGRMWNGFDAGRFLQLETDGKGNFYLRWSTDGVVWNPLSSDDTPIVDGNEILVDPTVREDMNGLPLQIGLAQCTFGGGSAFVEFDNFCLGRDLFAQATGPQPSDGGSLDPLRGMLSWSPGDFAQSGTSGQAVYFGTSYADVNAATTSDSEYKGSANVTGPDASGRYSYDVIAQETPAVGTTYYWRIDEVNVSHGDSPWKGNTWEFTVQNYTTVDSFDSYPLTTNAPAATPGTIRKVWVDGYYSSWRNIWTGGSYVQSSSDPCDGYNNPIGSTENLRTIGAQSMKFYYDNDGAIGWLSKLYAYDPGFDYTTTLKRSEAIAAIDNAARISTTQHESLGFKRNWSGYKLMRIPYYGDPNNTIVATDKLYIGIDDSDANPAVPVVVYNPDNTILQQAGWHDWYFKLSDFTDQNANLTMTDIYRIYVGVGSRTAPANGGTGAVFIDDIQLLATGVCIPGSVIEDLDYFDCTVNENDLEVLTQSSDWSGPKTVLPTPIIDLDASVGFITGPPLRWQNTGTGGGYFYDANTSDSSNPEVKTVEGKTAVVFDDTDLLVWMDNAGSSIIPTPKTLTSDTNEPNDFTVIYEVWNLNVAAEEHVMSWTRRGTDTTGMTTGTAAQICYGTSNQFGAVIHWDAPDMGFDVYEPPAHTWHKIGITYDGTTEVVAVDGIIQSVENKNLRVLADDMVTLGAGYLVSTDDVNVPNWVGGHGFVTDTQWALRYTGALASMKVYAGSITPADLVLQTGTKADLFLDNKIDFKDVAVFANKWLVGPVLFGD